MANILVLILKNNTFILHIYNVVFLNSVVFKIVTGVDKKNKLKKGTHFETSNNFLILKEHTINVMQDG